MLSTAPACFRPQQLSPYLNRSCRGPLKLGEIPLDKRTRDSTTAEQNVLGCCRDIMRLFTPADSEHVRAALRAAHRPTAARAALRCAALRCAALRCAACSAQLRCALAIDSYRPIRSSARTAGAVTCGAVACPTSHDCAEIGSVETVHGGVVAQAVARIRAAVESHPRDLSQVGRSFPECLKGRVATAALSRWHACTAGNCCGNLAIGPGGVKRTQGYSTVLNATPWARVALLRAFTPAAHWQRRIRIRISDSHSRAAALPALAAVSGSALRR